MKPSKWLTLKETKNDGHKSLQIYMVNLQLKQARDRLIMKLKIRNLICILFVKWILWVSKYAKTRTLHTLNAKQNQSTLSKKIQKWKFLRGKLKIYFLRGSGPKKEKRIKNIQKLGNYLPFEQKKWNWYFFEKKTKNHILGG